MTTKSAVWKCRPGGELVEKFKAPVAGRSWIAYDYCSMDGLPFRTTAVDLGDAHQQRDVFLERHGRTPPKLEPKPPSVCMCGEVGGPGCLEVAT